MEMVMRGNMIVKNITYARARNVHADRDKREVT